MSRHDPVSHRAPTWRVARLALAFGFTFLVAGPSLVGMADAAEKEKKGDEGSRLSDAARETVKEPDRQRTLHADDKPSRACGSSVDFWISGSASAGSDSYDESPGTPGHDLIRRLHVGAVVEAGSRSGPDFAPATRYGLRVGISDRERTSLDIMVLGGSAPFMPGSDVATLFREPGEVALDGSVRYALTPRHAGLGIAPLVGFRAGWLSWRYLNGIWLEQDGDVYQVHSDGIDHYSPYLGVAVTLMRSRHVELGITGMVGWRFYGSRTDAGLRNDLFGQGRFGQLRLETRFSL